MVPSGWDLVEAQDICQRISVGIVVKPKDYYVPEGEGVRAFRSANVREGYVEDSNWTYISDVGHQKNKKSILQAGDVLVVRTGYPGTACVVPEQYAGSNCIDIIFARPDQTRVLPEYLSDFTNSEYGKKQVLDGQGGLAQQHFNVGSYNRLRVPLPPLPEQRKIADILSTWDAAIEKTEALLATAKSQKRALMQSLLTGKRRFPAFEGQPWKDVRLGEMGKSISGGTPDSTVLAYWDGDIDWATPTDITKLKTRFIYGTARRITREGLKKSSAKLVDAGALLICTRATIGDLAIATGPICTNQGFKNLVLSADYDPDFVFYLLQFFKKELIRYACGSTFLELSKKDFDKRSFMVPALEEQNSIAAVLNDAEDQIAEHAQSITKLRTEKKALMQQLLTGKRRVVV